MSDVTRVSVIPWFFIYLIAKIAGIQVFQAWSWWWLLLPIVPIVVELFKVVFGE